MTRLSIKKIGLVANYSTKGDWGFDLAFHLAKSHSFHLNIFNFMESPYSVSSALKPDEVPSPEKINDQQFLISEERALREYYDDLLGDFVDVGFKLCLSVRHNLELRHCLREREYNLLIIPYLERNGNFGTIPIEEFCYRFVAPIILVGPDQPNQYYINAPARLIMSSLDLPLKHWEIIEKPEHFAVKPII